MNVHTWNLLLKMIVPHLSNFLSICTQFGNLKLKTLSETNHKLVVFQYESCCQTGWLKKWDISWEKGRNIQCVYRCRTLHSFSAKFQFLTVELKINVNFGWYADTFIYITRKLFIMPPAFLLSFIAATRYYRISHQNWSG